MARSGGGSCYRAVGRAARGGTDRRAARARDPTPLPGRRHRAVSGRPASRRARRAGGRRRHPLAVRAPGRGVGALGRRPGRRHHRHRLGEVAVLQPAHARRAAPRPPRPGAVPVPDQGAGPGPGAGAARARPGGHTPGDLRRRHAAGRAGGDPQARQRHPHQPRHAPRRDPAQPPGLGRPTRQPGRGRGRRGPRLPGRVRLSRRQRAAAPAPPGLGLRHRAALPARLGDGGQPGASWPRR